MQLRYRIANKTIKLTEFIIYPEYQTLLKKELKNKCKYDEK